MMQLGLMCATTASYLISYEAVDALSLPLCYFTTTYLFLQFAFSTITVSPPPAAMQKVTSTSRHRNPLHILHVVATDSETTTGFRTPPWLKFDDIERKYNLMI